TTGSELTESPSAPMIGGAGSPTSDASENGLSDSSRSENSVMTSRAPTSPSASLTLVETASAPSTSPGPGNPSGNSASTHRSSSKIRMIAALALLRILMSPAFVYNGDNANLDQRLEPDDGGSKPYNNSTIEIPSQLQSRKAPDGNVLFKQFEGHLTYSEER
ncbi:hypothetical protein V5O48_015980, partial [Marasmius crinis-equi]